MIVNVLLILLGIAMLMVAHAIGRRWNESAVTADVAACGEERIGWLLQDASAQVPAFQRDRPHGKIPPGRPLEARGQEPMPGSRLHVPTREMPLKPVSTGGYDP